MGYSIGLDVGIKSVGYAILRTDSLGNPIRIEHMNSVIFPAAEEPKTGASLAEPRREKRGARRRNRRMQFRKHRTKQLFIKYGLLSKEEIEQIFTSRTVNTNIYELRAQALDELLSNSELFQILYFFSGHRGFKSNRKSELKEKDMGIIHQSMQEMEKEMTDGGYRTIGEYLHKNEKYIEHKRNKHREDGFLGTVRRDFLEEEIKRIIASQRKLGNNLLTQDFEEAYVGNEQKKGIFNAQRDFDEGPGAGPYSGNQIEKLIGYCTFEKGEKRAPKASFTFQYFSLLSNLNNLSYKKSIGGTGEFLDIDQKKKVIEKAFQKKAITYKDVKKLLELPKEAHFNLLNYGSKKSQEDTEKATFIEMKAYHVLKKAIGEELFQSLSHDNLDEIGYGLTAYSSDNSRRKFFHDKEIFSGEQIEELLPIHFTGFGHLSIKAMKKIIPFLEEGLTYDKACKEAGYDFQQNNIDRAYIHQNVNNPVVKRAVSQTIKIVQNITRKYGAPDSIHIELARELGKSREERNEIKNHQEDNQAYNKRIAQKLEEYQVPVNGENITRLKLWEEQSNFDPYTGEIIPFEKVFSNEYEVDHIIPYSISFDDSFANKVLVSRTSNQEKGNRIPLEYLKGSPEHIEKFGAIAAKIKNHKKRECLLKKKLTDEDKKGWKQRNLNDTRYISKLLLSYFQQNIAFSENLSKKQRTFAVNGSITAKLRARWGFNKLRSNGDKHHALDALIVACITPKYVKEVTNFSKLKELRFNKKLWASAELLDELEKEVIQQKGDYDRIFNQQFPLPWTKFREEVVARMSDNPKELMKNSSWETYTPEEIENIQPIFVVRIPNKKVTGPAHAETIRSPKRISEGKTISRVAINKLKLNQSGEIISGKGEFFRSEDQGWLCLYSALKAELEVYDGDGEKAFPNGEFNYKQGEQYFKVRKVKMVSSTTLSTPLNERRGVADNEHMVRIDVYKVSNKYRFIPVYVADTVKKELPTKACIPKKSYGDWIEVDEDDFLFSLYPGDMIHIEHKKGISIKYEGETKGPDKLKHIWAYYNSADISTGSIEIQAHDNSYSARGIGIATLVNFEKYQVDYFGNYYKVREKVRQTFSR